MVLEFPVTLSRHAFSARDAARSGDMWRAFQDAAVIGSSKLGWSPQRYREEGIAFVVRSMTASHHREARYGEAVVARTWVTNFRRGLLCTRQIHLTGAAGALASCTQEWAHVSVANGMMRPSRASAELQAVFEEEALEPAVQLPGFVSVEDAPEHRFDFEVWHTWMDPLAHANHPAYVDWCDEAISRVMSADRLDPLALEPVGEHVKWRAGVQSGQASIISKLVGRTEDGAVVCAHRIVQGEGPPKATATTIRRLATGATHPLADALGRAPTAG